MWMWARRLFKQLFVIGFAAKMYTQPYNWDVGFVITQNNAHCFIFYNNITVFIILSPLFVKWIHSWRASGKYFRCFLLIICRVIHSENRMIHAKQQKPLYYVSKKYESLLSKEKYPSLRVVYPSRWLEPTFLTSCKANLNSMAADISRKSLHTVLGVIVI